MEREGEGKDRVLIRCIERHKDLSAGKRGGPVSGYREDSKP